MNKLIVTDEMNFHDTQITDCIGTVCTMNYKFGGFQSLEEVTRKME